LNQLARESCFGSEEAMAELAQKRGEAFFKNSAVAVDKSIQQNGFENFGHTLRYMKKGMLSDH